MNSLRETFVKFFLNGSAFLPVRCIRGFHIPRLLLSVQNVPYLRHILSLQFCDSYGKYVALHSEFILTFSNILTELLRHHIFFFSLSLVILIRVFLLKDVRKLKQLYTVFRGTRNWTWFTELYSSVWKSNPLNVSTPQTPVTYFLDLPNA